MAWLSCRRRISPRLSAVKLASAAFRLLSASIRKFAATTTFSPAVTPLVTSTKPSPRRPSLTGRGSKRPSPRSTCTICRLPLSMTADDRHGEPHFVASAGVDLDVGEHFVLDCGGRDWRPRCELSPCASP